MMDETVGDTFLRLFLDAVRARRTGALEWRDDPRRRLFFFDGGQLTLIQSNLKSESAARLAEREPELAGAALAARVAGVRFSETVGEAVGTVTWHEGARAPNEERADVEPLLWLVAGRLPALDERAYPTTTLPGALDRMQLEAPTLDYLRELDGTRPLEDVLAFGPTDPARLARAIAVGVAIGAVSFLSAPRAAAVIAGPATGTRLASASPPAPTPSLVAPAAPAFDVDDIASLIQDELGGAPPPETAASSRPVAGPADEDTFVVRMPPSTPPAIATRADPVAARFGPAVARIRGADDHFAVLGVSHEDAPDVMRRAYFQLARELHPDQLGDAPAELRDAAVELFDRVRAAWEVLGNDASREAYVARVIRGEKTEDEKAMERVRAILDAENDFKRGVADLNAGRLPSAHDLFARAHAAVSDEPEYAAYHGYTTFKLAGRDQTAADRGFEELRAALKANEKMDGAWVLLGMAQRARGNDAAARTAFVTALKLKPANPDAVREMRRMERDKEAPPPAPGAGGLFSRLFGKKSGG
jgi:curved DNA-binding protein CbpA